MTSEIVQAMIDAVAECNGDPDICCMILTGAGDRAFCAGSDIRDLDRYDAPRVFRNRPEYCDALRSLRKPIIPGPRMIVMDLAELTASAGPQLSFQGFIHSIGPDQ